MSDISSVAAEVYQILSSLKNSIDPSIPRSRNDDISLDSIAALAGDLEQLRFKFYSISRQGGKDDDYRDFNIALSELQNDLVNLLRTDNFLFIASRFSFKLRPTTRRSMITVRYIEPELQERISVYDAVKIIVNLISKLSNSEYITDILAKNRDTNDLGFELTESVEYLGANKAVQNLKRLVPQQKVAPVQFKIENDKIFVEKTSSATDSDDRLNTSIAKGEILENGKTIIEHLQKSNCDKRLIKNIENLHSQIGLDANAIQIGISNISFGVMSQTFRNELPDAVSALLQAHNISINMYVAQFPDWRKFSENASVAIITEDDIKIVDESTKQIIEYLEKNENVADLQVVQVFKQLRKLTISPSQSNKKAVFAVVRTIENLLSKTFQFATTFIEETAVEVRKKAVRTAATLIIALGLGSAATISPVAQKIDELSWLKNAFEIVKKQINIGK